MQKLSPLALITLSFLVPCAVFMEVTMSWFLVLKSLLAVCIISHLSVSSVGKRNKAIFVSRVGKVGVGQ